MLALSFVNHDPSLTRQERLGSTSAVKEERTWIVQ
jgi:hypothetical protein